MNRFSDIISQILLEKIEYVFSDIPEEKLRLLCLAYAEQIVPIVSEQICQSELNFEEVPLTLPKSVKNKLDQLILETSFEVLDKISSQLPEGNAKQALVDEVKTIIAKGYRSFVDDRDWKKAVETEVKAFATGYAKKGLGISLAKLKSYLPENQYVIGICEDAELIASDIVDAVTKGEDIESIYAVAGRRLELSLKKHAGAYAKEELNKSVNFAIDYVAQNAKKKVHGKGSRKINKQIDNVARIVSDSLTGHLTDNAVCVINGDKDVGEALKDTALETAKDSARTYMEKHGAELAKEAIETITVKVAQKMGNEATRQLVLRAGSSLANVNTVTAVVGGIYDVARSFKDFLDGRISKTELLRQIGEKGSSACLSSMGATYGGGVGFAVGGPAGAAIGAAIGSMAAYVASSLLYGSVLQAFEAEEAARIRAEQTHAFCEAAIERMRAEREEFERQAELLFKERQTAAIEGFKVMESAVLTSDFDKFSAGLNRITVSFGRKLQFTNFKEFDAFMESDEDFDL